MSNAFGAVWENGLETPGIASGSASMSTKIMDPLYQRKKKALVVIHAVSKTKKNLKTCEVNCWQSMWCYC